MQRVLRNLADGGQVYDHCRTQSDYGGLAGTVAALQRRGLLNDQLQLTQAGRKAAGRTGTGRCASRKNTNGSEAA